MFRIRLMFEWGGGCLWYVDEVTHAKFGVGPLEDRLGLTPALLERLAALSKYHDTNLNWSDPASASKWTPGEALRFNDDALALADELRAALGPSFSLVYQPL
jgi:hypothetical protein